MLKGQSLKEIADAFLHTTVDLLKKEAVITYLVSLAVTNTIGHKSHGVSFAERMWLLE